METACVLLRELEREKGSLSLADLRQHDEAWQATLDRLQGVSPAVEDGGLGCAYVDTVGLARLYGGYDSLAQALIAAMSCQDSQVGLASSKFPAYVAATTAAPGWWAQVPEDVASYLAPFTVDVLPLQVQVLERLRGFGLTTLGQVAELPLEAVAAQFGKPGTLAWELAHGIDQRPLVPRRPQVVVREALTFSAPVVATEALLMGLESLLVKAFARKELRGRCARVALLEAEVPGARSFAKRFVFKEPVAGKERALFVFRNQLAYVSLPGPVEALSLTLTGIGDEVGRQASLFSNVREQDNLRETIRELRARFGGEVPIYQVREAEPWSRIPERRRVLVPYDP